MRFWPSSAFLVSASPPLIYFQYPLLTVQLRGVCSQHFSSVHLHARRNVRAVGDLGDEGLLIRKRQLLPLTPAAMSSACEHAKNFDRENFLCADIINE